MSAGLVAAALKETASKAVEKVKDVKESIEKEADEAKETIDTAKKIIQEADVESAKNKSLKSIIEENKEKRDNIEKNSKEADEAKESHEGLTDEEKEKLRELTGWSDEILDAIGSWKEAEIYMKANLKEVGINGKKCLIREDIDLDQVDEDGISNRDRMERGQAPLTKDGEKVELHHIGQKQSSPLAELTMEEHRGVGNDTILHDKTKESEIDRKAFAKERSDHWKDRASDAGGE